jgi:hypothetical protein
VKQTVIRVTTFLMLFFSVSLIFAAGKSTSRQVVDSGSFGVYIGGRRVATESFRVEQGSTMSLAHSELRVEDGTARVAQSAEMEIEPNGDLHRYEWQEYQPQKAELTVLPNDEFLTEHITPNPVTKDKSQELPHLLPHSTVILDDNFFSHREILAWRYLAAGCRSEGGSLKCNLAPAQFGVLIPNQHASTTVSMEYKGREKVIIKGAPKELGAFRLQTEAGDWFLYLDENQKLVRIVIPSENTEILRD